ncbi:branched-chain amino acid ABC transporter permease [Bosea sp. (in: a-proteobacteria)]|jgi:branched-chain amino acid transport system permease protein|uniref:branched-chain amino acid ABC transporter permease n=1 Tax=Bosea sp. (in: a-proteobacteria) TaxID=1871050 RepID=UPI002DDD52CA|nr:branched-chain amino acid ABC transporter permease [Bosea sp. (in: a-proteobacteria)]HEV2509492.1 branched-chain amino acid ABC transporter permease [Bosea sp. (in: a-proteobacteria)]
MLLLAALDGLAYGSLIFLVAVGLSLIFGVLGIVNVAHGSFYAIGAYVAAAAVLALGAAGLPTWLAFPALLLAAALVGILVGGLVEIALLRRVYGKEEVLQLIVTFAVFMILEDAQKVVFGVQPYFANAPMNWLGTVEVFGIFYTTYQLILMPLVAAVVLLGLRFFLRRTSFGRAIVAVTQDREAATAMGIDAARVYLITFIIGASLAALGGALASATTSLTPGIGAGTLVLSFAVAATAGLGRIEGAAVAALLIGLGRSAAVYFAPEFDVLIPYLIMMLVLLVRPQGLFSTVQTRKV